MKFCSSTSCLISSKSIWVGVPVYYTAKNAQPVLAWWKQHWTMLCCPHCSRLLTILFNIVTPDCRFIQAHQLVQYCWQPWTMWAAQHCWILFSSGQNRLCVFCCVVETHCTSCSENFWQSIPWLFEVKFYKSFKFKRAASSHWLSPCSLGTK